MANFEALKALIRQYIKENGDGEITGDILQSVLIAMVTEVEGNGYVYAGIATPTTVPVTGNVFYIATEAGSYSNFGSVDVSAGITILKRDGTSWTKNQISYTDGVFDISAYNGSSYANLTAALGTNGANVPIGVRHNGMEVSFKDSNGVYQQCRYMKEYANTTAGNTAFVNIANWQCIDDEPIYNSNNLVKSGGVEKVIGELTNIKSYEDNKQVSQNGTIIDDSSTFISTKIPVNNGDTVYWRYNNAPIRIFLGLYAEDDSNLKTWNGNNASGYRTVTIDNSNAAYIIASFNKADTYNPLIKVNGNVVWNRKMDDGRVTILENKVNSLENTVEPLPEEINNINNNTNNIEARTRTVPQNNIGVSGLLDAYLATAKVGYYNGSGVYNSNSSYSTIFISIDDVPNKFVIIGPANYIHYFTSSKTWISCFSNVAYPNYYLINKSDIPQNCKYIAVCSTYFKGVKIFDKKFYDFNETYYYPTMRQGSIPNYTSQNYVSATLILPTYDSDAIRITINKDLQEGHYYKIEVRFYSVCDVVSTSGAQSLYIKTYISTGETIEVILNGEKGFCYQIEEYDSSDVQQQVSYYSFSNVVLVQRVSTPLLDIAVHDNAYVRNLDRDNMLAAAVRVNKVANGSMDFMSLIVTDSHGDAVAENNSITLADKFEYIQSLIHCGDFCASNANNFATGRYTNLVKCKKPFYFVVGNHDVGNSKNVNECITNSQCYSRYILPLVNAGLLTTGEYTEGANYYYHDFTSKKIRLIVIYEYDDPNDLDPNDNTKYRIQRGQSIIRQAQAEWFCNAMKNTPAGYGIIVAMHNPFSALADCDTNKIFNSQEWEAGRGSQRLFSTDLWADIVDAWVNKRADYTCDMVCTGSAEYLNVDGRYYSFNYDFSGRSDTAKFLCFLGGHVHADCVWKHRTYPYQYQITPVCATTEQANSVQSDIRRTPSDGPSKDSLTAIGYDIPNSKLRLVKLGVNITENGTKRDFEVIDTTI